MGIGLEPHLFNIVNDEIMVSEGVFGKSILIVNFIYEYIFLLDLCTSNAEKAPP